MPNEGCRKSTDFVRHFFNFGYVKRALANTFTWPLHKYVIALYIGTLSFKWKQRSDQYEKASHDCISPICTLLACAGCAKNADSKIQTKSSTSAKKAEITVAGSTAFEPLVKQAVKSYAQFNPSVKVNVLGGGSQAGLNQVDQCKVEIGTSDFFAAQQNIVNRDHLSDYKVAVVGIAVVANQKLKVNNLSASQLKDIFSGKITNWKQVGGKNQKITIVSRADGSGSRKAFELNVMGKTPIAAAEELSSNKHLEEYVAKTPGAIGYLAFPYLKDSKPKLKKIKIDNVTPTAEHVKDNSWKIWAYEHMYTRGMSRGEASKFITYMLGDDVQDGMLQKAGYISIHDMEVQKDEHGAMVKTGN